MVTTQLHITGLTSPTVTRARGLAAYERLRSRMYGSDPIEIDLSGEFPLSLSFLDEFIRHVFAAGFLDRLTFVTNKGEALRKLARVADIRGVDIWYRETSIPQIRRVDPLPATPTESVFLERKPEMESLGWDAVRGGSTMLPEIEILQAFPRPAKVDIVLTTTPAPAAPQTATLLTEDSPPWTSTLHSFAIMLKSPEKSTP